MPYAGDLTKFALFQQELIGTWENKTFPGSEEGGPGNPLSYNIMPLPQEATPDKGPLPYSGYILKNFRYYETIRFNEQAATVISIPATAPNRGGAVNQIAHALFYDQRVSFAEGPQTQQVVHVENGAWIYLDKVPQLPGPYANSEPPAPPNVRPQPADITVAKQISVPHGNSILALGQFDIGPKGPVVAGAPIIPGAPPPYPLPHEIETNRFTKKLVTPEFDFENPDVALTQNANLAVSQAVRIIAPEAYMHWRVTTEPLPHGKGAVTNIPFEERRADVTAYTADYWLLQKEKKFQYLAYSQTILMEMRIGPRYSERRFLFPHVTCNTVAKVL